MKQNGITESSIITREKCFALPNSRDNSRCIACCLGGIINAAHSQNLYFDPVQLDKDLLKNSKGVKTIQAIACFVLTKKCFRVVMNVPMPVSWYRIYKYGNKALNKKVVEFLDKNFDLSSFHYAVKNCYKAGVCMKHVGGRDIIRLLDLNPDSYIMAGVNPHLLYNSNSHKKGGHYVLVLGYERDCILISDPGLPYKKRVKIPKSNFDLAWKGNSYNTGEVIIATPEF